MLATFDRSLLVADPRRSEHAPRAGAEAYPAPPPLHSHSSQAQVLQQLLEGLRSMNDGCAMRTRCLLQKLHPETLSRPQVAGLGASQCCSSSLLKGGEPVLAANLVFLQPSLTLSAFRLSLSGASPRSSAVGVRALASRSLTVKRLCIFGWGDFFSNIEQCSEKCL